MVQWQKLGSECCCMIGSQDAIFWMLDTCDFPSCFARFKRPRDRKPCLLTQHTQRRVKLTCSRSNMMAVRNSNLCCSSYRDFSHSEMERISPEIVHLNPRCHLIKAPQPFLQPPTHPPLRPISPQPPPDLHQRLPQPIIPPLALPPLRLVTIKTNPPDLIIRTRLNQDLLPGP